MKRKRGEGLVKQLTLPLKNGATMQVKNVGQQKHSTTWALWALGSARWNFRAQYERWPGSSRSCSQRMPGNKKRIFHISKWFPGFGKDRKKKIFSKRIGWCVMFLSSKQKQKLRKFKSMLNRILIRWVIPKRQVILCCGRTCYSFVWAGRCWDVFCFQDLWPRKGGHTFHKDASDDFLKVQMLDILPENWADWISWRGCRMPFFGWQRCLRWTTHEIMFLENLLNTSLVPPKQERAKMIWI